jgi:hypothetical protein
LELMRRYFGTIGRVRQLRRYVAAHVPRTDFGVPAIANGDTRAALAILKAVGPATVAPEHVLSPTDIGRTLRTLLATQKEEFL